MKNVFDSIVLKDIIKRNSIKNITLFERVMEYLVTNPSQTFSPTNMMSVFETEKIPVSSRTIYECLDYAEEAILMANKYYLTDLGLGQILNINKRTQYGAYLENIVYNELVFR